MDSTHHPLSVAEVWAELALHLDWSDRLCLCFVFCDSSVALAQLRQCVQDAWHSKTAAPRIMAPDDAQEAETAILQALQAYQPGEGATRIPLWVEILRVDGHDSKEWDNARARLLARLNEMREWLIRELAQPLIVCLPANWFERCQQVAPDLWHVRAYAAELAAEQIAPVQIEPWLLAPVSNEQTDILAAQQACQQAWERWQAAGEAQKTAMQRELAMALRELSIA